MDQAKLDLLWERVEAARLRWKSARTHVNGVNENRDGLPSADGSYTHVHALRAQRLAVTEYRRALQDFSAALAAEPEEPATATGITPREREVLTLIASGKSSKQIAAELGIAFRTAVCHRYRIQTKLHAHNTADMTRAALKMGLIQL